MPKPYAKDELCADCPHTRWTHDTGWDAAGCMSQGCFCRAFRSRNPKAFAIELSK